MSSNRNRSRCIRDFDSADQSVASSNHDRRGRGNRRNDNSSIQPNDEANTDIGNQLSGDISSIELEILIGNYVRFILLHENTKLPIKHNEMMHFFIDDNHHAWMKRKDVNVLFPAILKRLNDDFGLKLVEIPDSYEKSYILQTNFSSDLLSLDNYDDNNDNTRDNNVDIDANEEINNLGDDTSIQDDDIPPNDDDILLDENLTYDDIFESSKKMLLMAILSFIMLDETDRCSENDLFDYLKDLGLSIETKSEQYGHDLPKRSIVDMITKDFVSQRYLKRTKKPNQPNQKVEYLYEWGTRSFVEFKQTDLVEFIQEIYDGEETGTKSSHFFQQLKKKAEKNDQTKLLTNSNNDGNTNHSIADTEMQEQPPRMSTQIQSKRTRESGIENNEFTIDQSTQQSSIHPASSQSSSVSNPRHSRRIRSNDNDVPAVSSKPSRRSTRRK